MDHKTSSSVLLLFLCRFSNSGILEEACPAVETCNNDENHFTETCDCGPPCQRYRMCCIDSPYVNPPDAKEKCREMPKTFVESGIFLVEKCDPQWSGNPDIKFQCENSSLNIKDPIMSAPMTNPTTKYTYKNYFCALCNDDLTNSTFWNVKFVALVPPGVHYPFTDDEITSGLVFNDNEGKWQSMPKRNYNQGYTSNLPIDIDIYFDIPSTLKKAVVTCHIIVVHECAETWDDEVVKAQCESYLSAIEFEIYNKEVRVFRNIHCAICNYFNDPFYSCSIHDIRLGVAGGPGSSRPNFMRLFDVNLSDGKKVGRVAVCPEGYVVDTFRGKLTNCSNVSDTTCKFNCRKLSCSRRGYVVKNNACVKDNSNKEN